ncbi:APC family permease [Rhizorhabdus dicambivorans]|uniref:Arginine/agmatine antiporter n=1 Tax=Rhizorhabdus dicambivorans TaxID=1850238 RepID=A0A2A4G2V8_9SPHN|nr:amino acid permease [Rhizorhabdus dicambivorans]ATE65099.1 amino acid permease [Rhizorhabdus dicambivorans]PCE44372.1 amino acid permease [Rhizorhabdus dicambivorans]
MTGKENRPLGPIMATALVVGNMIGSGVYLLPASLAPYGWNVIPAWGITIAGSLAIAAVFAGLCRSHTQTGGPYVYVRAAFGNDLAFFVAWAYWISLFVGNGAIAVAAVSYMSAFVPTLATDALLSTGITILLVWTMTAINISGTRNAGWVQLIATALKVLPLVAVVIIAAMAAPQGDLSLPDPHRPAIGLAAISTAGTLTLWAFLGLESATVPAGKVANPQRTIPLATLGGTALTGVIYLFACTAVILLLAPEVAAHSAAPFAAVIERYWGSGAAHVVAAFAMISAIGALNGWILLQGEMPAAMAAGGVFPKALARLAPNGVPVRAHILSTALVTAILALNASRTTVDMFTFIALLATTASLLMYIAVAAAALKLGGVRPWIAIAAALYSFWALYGAGVEANKLGLLLVLAGVPVWWLMRRKRTAPLT